mmetsp:Transcript_114070/g.363682  ORF Transcript_114070/g.363682 Transcript_114070/m.363682 type:complete len:346 (+) Transcript_114070:1723-2760(+)
MRELVRRDVVDASVCLGECVQHERTAEDDAVVVLQLHLAEDPQTVHLHSGHHHLAVGTVALDLAILCHVRGGAYPHPQTLSTDQAHPWRDAQTPRQLEVARLSKTNAVLAALDVRLEDEAAAQVWIVRVVHQTRQRTLQAHALSEDGRKGPLSHVLEVPAGNAELFQGLLPLRHHLLRLYLLVLPALLVVLVQVLRPLHPRLDDVLGARLVHKRHLLLESPELLLQALHQTILVHLGGLLCLHLDVLHRGSKFQRAQAFLEVSHGRTQRPDHSRLRVAIQGVVQEHGQLGVPEPRRGRRLHQPPGRRRRVLARCGTSLPPAGLRRGQEAAPPQATLGVRTVEVGA